jgi:hypothetical protein
MVAVLHLTEWGTFLSYMVIAFFLVLLWHRRRAETEHGWIVLLFAAFIGQCGLSHGLLAISFVIDTTPVFTMLSVPRALTAIFAAAIFPYVVLSWLSHPAAQSLIQAQDARLAVKREKIAALMGENAILKTSLAAERERANGLDKALNNLLQPASGVSINMLQKAQEKLAVLPSEKREAGIKDCGSADDIQW